MRQSSSFTVISVPSCAASQSIHTLESSRMNRFVIIPGLTALGVFLWLTGPSEARRLRASSHCTTVL